MNPGSGPKWYQQATLYHIYPLSFADSNADGFGDLAGILAHLDYLNDGTDRSLGVGAIWLSPVYTSPMADWGYDVANYTAIDPRFGTMADFDRLLAEVHRRGMKLLMDYVPNHTSIQHPWFKASRSSRTDPKRDWYIWADASANGGPPNNWLSSFGGSAWALDDATGQYYLHTFLTEQADLNWRNPAVREAMFDVLRFWLNKGVDGFRADAVMALIKDAKLRDDEPNPNFRPGISDPADRFLRVHSAGQRELYDVIGSYCDVLAEKPGRYMLSEAYLDIPGLEEMYDACQRHPVHAPFNFNLMSLQWGARQYREFIDQYDTAMGPDDWPNYVVGNHDRHRLVTRMGRERARLVAMLQLTLRGLPVVYFGDELALPDTIVADEAVQDEWEKHVPGRGLGRDGARTPMPWNGESGAGFTTVEPWLPIGSTASELNVEIEARQENSSLSMYRHLIQLRNQAAALSLGQYRSRDVDNPYVFAYDRHAGDERYMVILNFDSHHAAVTLPDNPGSWVAGTHQVYGDNSAPSGERVTLKPYEGRMYRCP